MSLNTLKALDKNGKINMPNGSTLKS